MDSNYKVSIKYVPSLFLGIFIGISLTIYSSYDGCATKDRRLIPSTRSNPSFFTSNRQMIEKSLMDTKADLDDIRQIVQSINRQSVSSSNVNSSLFVNTSIADNLQDNIRILCWILTYPQNHKTKAINVKNTWGRRCSKFLIMSSERDDDLGTIPLNMTEEKRIYLWAKTRQAWKYVYQHHINDADWFYKADDDTYASMENMRFFLQSYSPLDPIYFGYKLKAIVRQGYMSGGAGYVLSKTALVRLVKDALPDPDKCSQNDIGAEDAEVGICLEKVNVLAGDSRDYMKRGRFFIHNPVYHLRESTAVAIDETYWYWKNMFYKSDEGLNCCSNTAISWHYVQPGSMLNMEFFQYLLRVYGRVMSPQKLPKKVNFTEIEMQLRNDLPKEVLAYTI